VIRGRKVVAVEGVALAIGGRSASGFTQSDISSEPVQQRLAALICEVHDLLHSASAPRQDGRPGIVPQSAATTLRLGDITIDADRMTVTLAAEPVDLTSREILVLRYLLQHRGRVVTRQQLLVDVWGYRYTGDDRTIDVHVSRLRRKLPPLRGMLRAVKHVGYRLDPPEATLAANRRIANI
jgi:DNA-binding response OmpR family regulator